MYKSTALLISLLMSSHSIANNAEKDYQLGKTLSQQGDFEKSYIHFENALSKGHKSPEIHYELGQAYYAMNELDKSYQQFIQSYKNEYMKDTSLYYLAYILQLKEEYKKSKKHYTRILKMEESSEKLKQIAHFQIASINSNFFDTKEDVSEEYVKKYVLNHLERAYKINPNSDLREDIIKKRDYLLMKYGLSENHFKNGTPYPKKSLGLSFTQSFNVDSNITLATDLPSQVPTKKDALISKTSLGASYFVPLKKRWLIGADIGVQNAYYSDREDSEIFQNDNTTISLSPTLSYMHKANKRPATLEASISFDKSFQDIDAKKNKSFYGDALAFRIKEKVQYLSMGPSSISIQARNFTSYDSIYDNNSFSIDLEQMVLFKNGSLIIGGFQYLLSELENSPVYDSDNYTFRADYIYPDLFLKTNLIVGLSYVLQDQVGRPNIGIETLINPRIRLSRVINKNLLFSFAFDYKNKNSEDKETGDYSKFVNSFELSYRY